MQTSIEINRFLRLLENDDRIIIINRTPKEIFVRSKHGNIRIVRIPLIITPNMCFLAGCIISDGHLRKSKFSISIEITDRKILSIIKEKFEKIFLLNLRLVKRNDKRLNRQLRWILRFESKAIWLLFRNIFGIPAGKKSHIVRVPKIVINSNLEFKRQFISGFFLGDGGTKKNAIFFTFSNRHICSEMNSLLEEFNIFSRESVWLHNVSRNKVFDLLIRKEDDVNRFKTVFPLVNMKLQGSRSLVNRARLVE